MSKKSCSAFIHVLFLLALPLFCFSDSTYPLEVDALLRIKARLQDPYGNLKNWDNTTDPCFNWSGVICHSVETHGYRHVRHLQLLNKNLSGYLAPEIGHLKRLEILDFMWNNISGEIPKEIASITTLRLLLLNGNQLSGPLPPELGDLSELDRIQIDQNNISGPIPKSFASLRKAKHFHMNNNSLSGEIPKELSTLPELIHLLLDNNNLTGELPPELAEIPKLLIMQLDNNNFINEIPSTYANMKRLLKLSLRNCSLQGPVPDFSNMPQLTYLDLSHNDLTGHIPTKQLSLNITTIDLSHNNLNGSIPSNFSKLQQLQRLSLQDNQLAGSIPSDIGSDIKFMSNGKVLLDYRNNSLGNVTDIALLKSLPSNITLRLDSNPICNSESGLDMSRFCSSRNISDETNGSSSNAYCNTTVCTLPYRQSFGPNCYCVVPLSVGYRLKSPGISFFASYEEMFKKHLKNALNLSLDQLVIESYEWQPGPRLAMNLKFLPIANETVKSFNASEITRIETAFSQWDIPASDLFGPAEWLNFSFGAGGNDAQHSPLLSRGALAGLLVGTIFGTLLISTFIGIFLFRHYAKYLNNPSRKYHARKRNKVSGIRDFNFEEMVSATNNFSSYMKIGQGGYGDVYKGILNDGTVVAIKRARAGSLQGEEEFTNELEVLSRLHHRNLVSIVGYCDDQDEQMLVYEYMSNGNLKEHLSGTSDYRPLDFAMRLHLALGAAKGILYLHTEANPPIFHRDIKATNILLDDAFNSRVADFGLSRLAPVPSFEDSIPDYVSTVVKGTPGYLDPEYFLTHKLTDKSDVYSFGVVLLELLTGMEPISLGKNLVREVRAASSSGKVQSMIDPHMVSYPSHCIEPFIQLALQCAEDETELRPSMAEVVKVLTNIQQSMSNVNMKHVKCFKVDLIENPQILGAFSSSEMSNSDPYNYYSPLATPR
eukprot:TRINITY_DN11974_c0_g1_i3.p1 TRINITY_DN11974_c0_g1~~TRINITY_DN11974_c0_g1_i3.p1  ORF type:complete len:938 (-),score=164.38 TRINITY_DN11974_c0_g1_i3:191-3004(-)